MDTLLFPSVLSFSGVWRREVEVELWSRTSGRGRPETGAMVRLACNKNQPSFAVPAFFSPPPVPTSACHWSASRKGRSLSLTTLRRPREPRSPEG